MNALIGRLAVLCSLASTNALAWGPPPVPIQVDNAAGAQVEVWVDGAWRGSVLPNQARSFTTVPGSHTVTAGWANGPTMLDTRIIAAPGQITQLRVMPPLAQLILGNHGAAPVWVEIPGVAPFWSTPGTQLTVNAPWAASIPVQTSVYGRRGLIPIQQLSVAPCAGRPVSLEVGYTPATTITLTNQDPFTVRVYIGGVEAAVIPPGQTRTWDVAPGRFQVTVVQHQGGVLYDRLVAFDPRLDHQILVSGGYGRYDGGRQLWSTTTPSAPTRQPGYADPGYGRWQGYEHEHHDGDDHHR